MKQGILGESTEDVEKLDYVSNMFLKTESDKLRPCINYRRLDAGTVKTNTNCDENTLLAGVKLRFCSDFLKNQDQVKRRVSKRKSISALRISSPKQQDTVWISMDGIPSSSIQASSD